MHRLSKSRRCEHYNVERRFVEALRDKLGALANAQLKDDRQIGKNKSKNKSSDKQDKRKKRTQPKSIGQLKTEVHLLLNSVDIHPHQSPDGVSLANREESWLIRLDWDGMFHRPADTDYSEAYARARQEAAENQELGNTDLSLGKYDIQDYQLNQSPAWQFMSKFENYAGCRRKICSQLAKQNIPPTVVPHMNFFDFSEVLYNWSKEHQTKPFESTRSKNLKMFDACYGEEFSRVMSMLHYSPEYISRTREKMRQGICDPLLNFHHQTNVSRFKELDDTSTINDFSNMLLTFVQPHHRVLHFGNGYDVPKGIIFFGGYDQLYQVRRDPERELQYLSRHNKKAFIRYAESSR